MTVPQRERMRRVVAIAVCLGAITVAGTAWAALTTIVSPADEPAFTAKRVAPPTPAVVIGDSAIAALRWVPGADNAIIGFEHTLDLESCRRLHVISCFGREGRRPSSVTEALDFHGGKYHTLVVATGYNDGTSVFADSVVAVIDEARERGFRRIVWLTLRSDVDYVSPGSVGNHETFAANNETLFDLLAGGDYPEVVVADWGAYTADRAEWFVTDGVHYRQIGAWAASDYLTRKMAFLDGRPCPLPVAPGEPVQSPCPDPDVTGPIADIDALYDIGEDGVLCYEIGDNRRVECRYDTHVIQLTRVLQLGDEGADVRALQTRMQRLGVFTAAVDSVFGPATVTGVQTYQQQAGLTVNGIADVATLAAMGFDVSGITP